MGGTFCVRELFLFLKKEVCSLKISSRKHNIKRAIIVTGGKKRVGEEASTISQRNCCLPVAFEIIIFS